jgi:hypothetical protein
VQLARQALALQFFAVHAAPGGVGQSRQRLLQTAFIGLQGVFAQLEFVHAGAEQQGHRTHHRHEQLQLEQIAGIAAQVVVDRNHDADREYR